MPNANVIILRRGQSLDPDMAIGGDFMEILPETPWKVIVCEGAMASGRSSVDIAVETPDGTPARQILLRTSLSTLASIVTMARAAFPQEFEGSPLEADVDADERSLAQAKALIEITGSLAAHEGLTLHEMAHRVHEMAKAEMERRGE